MLGVNGTTHVDVVMGQQVDVLFRVGPAAKGEGAVLLAPRPVVRVEVAERSVNHRWHKKDVAVVTQDNLVEISWHQFFYTQKLNYSEIYKFILQIQISKISNSWLNESMCGTGNEWPFVFKNGEIEKLS